MFVQACGYVYIHACTHIDYVSVYACMGLCARVYIHIVCVYVSVYMHLCLCVLAGSCAHVSIWFFVLGLGALFALVWAFLFCFVLFLRQVSLGPDVH